MVWVDSPQYGFRLVYPDGSQDVYGFVIEWGRTYARTRPGSEDAQGGI